MNTPNIEYDRPVDPQWDLLKNQIKSFKNTETGVPFVGLLEASKTDKKMESHWIGALGTPVVYEPMPEIAGITLSFFWIQNIEKCIGIYVSSPQQKDLLKALGVRVPIAIFPPFGFSKSPKFRMEAYNRNPKVYVAGVGGSDIAAIKGSHSGIDVINIRPRETGPIAENKSNYLEALQTGIFILGDDDMRAHGLIMDCISHGTPIILSANSLYKQCLSPQYPLFSSILDDVITYVNDSEYLKM